MKIFLLTILLIIICILANYVKNRIYKKSINNLKDKYSVGEKIIYHQINCYYNRMVGCEILEKCYSTKFRKRNTPLYKVKAYVGDNNTTWVIPEWRIECLATTYGEFPKY
ncbi:TPA: hypothetical protein KPK07_003657 [Clostridioides difficile]|nr:hypothetical protein [Clostridioides difficile]MBY2552905.1 hypothetical protein [Clostridioides difficile]HBG2263797.1 hypothetical protein [Clostridioides difficile]HBG2463868.1 hypothetical protein [Clostridioides difficile]HDN2505946.1 hypothetical protein [Clostridioides difficile]